MLALTREGGRPKRCTVNEVEQVKCRFMELWTMNE